MQPRRDAAAQAAHRARFLSVYHRATAAGFMAGGALMLCSLLAWVTVKEEAPSLLMGLAALSLPVLGSFAGDAWARRRLSALCDHCGARLDLQRDPKSTNRDPRYQFICLDCGATLPANGRLIAPGGKGGGSATPALAGVDSPDKLLLPAERIHIDAASGLSPEQAGEIDRIGRKGASLHLTVRTPSGMDRDLQDLVMLELNEAVENSRLDTDRLYVETTHI